MTGNEKRTLSPVQLIYGGLGIVGGIWLIAAPFVLNYAGATKFDAKLKKAVAVDLSAVTTSSIICGVLILGLTAFALLTATNVALAKARFYATIAVILVGVYLMGAPYLFDVLHIADYMALDIPNTNDQLMGIVTIIVAGFAFQKEFLSEPTTTTAPAQVAPTA